MKSIITTGNTVAEALQKGLNELCVEQSMVDVKVLATPKAGFFGLGATKARVEVTLKDTKSALDEVKAFGNEDTSKTVETVAKNYKTDLNENEKRAKEFVDGLLAKMNVLATANVCYADDSNVHLEITGKSLGTIIGRRGETLDAIQYIASLASKEPNSQERFKVLIDAENYRAKRLETLKNVANKMGAKVLKTKKNMTLEPMSPFERRAIHEFLQDTDGVHTFSTGKEPNRRVVIGYGEGNR